MFCTLSCETGERALLGEPALGLLNELTDLLVLYGKAISVALSSGSYHSIRSPSRSLSRTSRNNSISNTGGGVPYVGSSGSGSRDGSAISSPKWTTRSSGMSLSFAVGQY